MAEKSVEYSELLTLTSDIVTQHTSNNAVPSVGNPLVTRPSGAALRTSALCHKMVYRGGCA